MPSLIFRSDEYTRIERDALNLLQAQKGFLSDRTRDSTRATGDAVQSILSEGFQGLLGDCCRDYSSKFARRAMADLAFTDTEEFYHVVDVKTHRLGTKFNMPNLTSVERLARFYEDDKNTFVVLLVAYSLPGAEVVFDKVTFVPVEWFDWDCLTIGALGWGQIQIANANRILVTPHHSRKSWMLDLCEAVLAFYPKEISKIQDRIERFQGVRSFWMAKPDD